MRTMIDRRQMEVGKCYRFECYGFTYKVKVDEVTPSYVRGDFKSKDKHPRIVLKKKSTYSKRTCHGAFNFAEMSAKVLPIKSL